MNMPNWYRKLTSSKGLEEINKKDEILIIQISIRRYKVEEMNVQVLWAKKIIATLEIQL